MSEVRYVVDRDMRRAAGVPMSRESPFSYDDPGAEIADQERQRDALSRLLWTITAATLLVSLTGYSGIALAATAARRREIALRMAMGASSSDILAQIATEHAVLSGLAALGGLGLGVGAAAGASLLWEWPIHFSWVTGAGAVFISCATGLSIGVLVAYRSSQVSPSVAAKS